MTGSTYDVDRPRPQPRADLSAYPLDDELVIYDPVNGESFVLNSTGRLVWERCDGTRTSDEIAHEIAALHGITTDRALADITELLETFERSNLLTTSQIP